MQIIHARDWLAIKSNDHIAFAQSRFLCRTRARDRGYDHAALARKIVETNHAAMERRRLRLDSDVAAADSAIAQQASRNKLRGVDSDGEAESLRPHNRR